MRERCAWCFKPQPASEPLVITISADGQQSPDLCDACTDAWGDGARKYSHIRRMRPIVRPPKVNI